MKRFATLLLSLGFLFGVVAAVSVAPASAATASATTTATAQHSCYTKGNGGSGSGSGGTMTCCGHHHGTSTGVQTCSNSAPGGTGSKTPSGPTVTSAPPVAAATGLAFTGADVAVTVAVAAILVALGLVVVRLSRRPVS